MIKGYELLTAWRYIRSPKKDGFISIVSWFSLLGITLGVAALILVMAVMGGFRDELLGRILGINGHVTLSNGQQTIQNYNPIENRLLKNTEVKSAIGFIRKQALFTIGESAKGVIVRGVDVNSLGKREIFHKAVSKKHLESFKNGRGVLIGVGLSRVYNVSVGDEITLVVPQKNILGMNEPKVVNYRVAGVFEVGMFRYDSGMIFMPIKQAQSLFNIKGVTQVEVILDDADNAQDFVEKIEGKYPSVDYFDAWQQVNQTFFNALEVERNTMFIILSIMILIAAFNIVTGQIMLVRDKTRSIAVMRTLGLKRISVVKVFFLIGAGLGTMGTILGIGLGILLTKNLENIRTITNTYFGVDIFNPEVYHLKTIPTVLDSEQILLIACFSMGVSFVAAFYPAIRAGRMHPVEGLRNE